MLSINVSELIWAVINFLLLMFLLNRFLYRPIISFMDERKARIEAAEAAQRDAQALADSTQSEQDAQLNAAREAAKLRLDEALAEGERDCDEAVTQLKAQSKQEKLHAGEARETLRAQYGSEVQKALPELSRKLAEKMLNENT